MKRLLIVVDYQNDFVNGSLGFEKAQLLEEHIIQLIKEYHMNGDEIIYTMDTHQIGRASCRERVSSPV